jgi:signal transduction histidine kinase
MSLGVTSSTTLDVLQANIDLLAEKERLEAEQARLVAIDQLRTEFIARLSHDLRTPLSSIIGFSELVITDDTKLPRQTRECVEAIHRNGHQLLAMINELLDLTTLESGNLRLHLDPVPLATLLADVQAATGPVLEAAGVVVEWPDLVPGAVLRGDRRRLLQALTNLLDNARKFTPRGGRVRLAMDVNAGGARLQVADSGSGIAPEHRAAVFRPYAKGTLRAQGHGLGLAIVKAIVDRHQGRIEVGDGLGSGTHRGCTITITLPAEPAT